MELGEFERAKQSFIIKGSQYIITDIGEAEKLYKHIMVNIRGNR